MSEFKFIHCPLCDASNVEGCDCVYHLDGLALNAYYTSIRMQQKENAK